MCSDIGAVQVPQFSGARPLSLQMGNNCAVVNWPQDDESEEEDSRPPLIERVVRSIGRFIVGFVEQWL